MQPRGDDGQLLLHAVGVGGDGLGQIVRQLKAGCVVPDTRLPVIGADAENVRDEVQVLDTAHEVVQVGVVGDVRDLPLAGQRLRLDGFSVNGDLPGVELQNPHHRLQSGGLARAVMSDKAVDLAGPDVQAQVVHGLFFAVGLCQMLDFQHNVLSCLSRSAARDPHRTF